MRRTLTKPSRTSWGSDGIENKTAAQREEQLTQYERQKQGETQLAKFGRKLGFPSFGELMMDASRPRRWGTEESKRQSSLQEEEEGKNSRDEKGARWGLRHFMSSKSTKRFWALHTTGDAIESATEEKNFQQGKWKCLLVDQ